MIRLLTRVMVASGLLFGCSVSPLGTCTATSNNCKNGAVCQLQNDPPVCTLPQGTCLDCITVTNVNAPSTWSSRLQPLTVTATIDSSAQITAASLQVAGQSFAGTPGTPASTYSFIVPGTVQTPGSETPLPFIITATDNAGHTLAPPVQPHGQLLIDDVGPVVSNVSPKGSLPGGDAAALIGGRKWFKQSTPGDIDVQADINDNGSGTDPASLKLVLQSNPATRVDDPLMPPTADSTTANRWHFHVPRVGQIAANGEGTFNFKVVAADKLGNGQQADSGTAVSTGTMGVDGVVPIASISANYPAAGIDCDNDPGGIVCGHDAAHWWRRGVGSNGAEMTAMTFTGNDQGSGMDPGGATCSITGSLLSCTPTSSDAIGATNATFAFKPNFSDATLGTLDTKTGGGPATVTVTVADAVGNASAVKSVSVDVSRLRWIQKLALKSVGSLTGAPIISSQPAPQVIVAGTNTSGDQIVGIKPTGDILWKGGATAGITSVTGNIAYDPSANVVYVLGGSFYALHVLPPSSDKYCTQSVTSSIGSPAIHTGGSAGVVLVSDSGSTPRTLNAFFPTGMTATGGSCGHAAVPAAIASATKIGPPTVSGGTIYWPYENSVTDAGVATATFSSGFSGIATHPLGTPSVTSFVGTYASFIVADALFFGNSLTRSYYRFSSAYALDWATTAFTGTTTLAANIVVAKGLALGMSGNPGQLYAYDKTTTTGSPKWSYPSSDVGAISSPVTASDGTIYFSDAINSEFQAIAPGASSATMKWNFKGPVGTALSGVGTEVAIDTNGIAYFGNGSNLFALITDVGAAAPSVGSDWPRTGFDNCNSSNTGFSCQ
jgi:hypothetical protein